MTIRSLRPDERDVWLRFRHSLWPAFTLAELALEQDRILADPERQAVLIAAAPSGEPVGFIEVSVREAAEGCTTSPVGYIEGWYVEPAARRRGVGSGLVAAAEAWSVSKGCREIASDAEIQNAASVLAHAACGFTEVGRVVLLRKALSRAAERGAGT